MHSSCCCFIVVVFFCIIFCALTSDAYFNWKQYQVQSAASATFNSTHTHMHIQYILYVCMFFIYYSPFCLCYSCSLFYFLIENNLTTYSGRYKFKLLLTMKVWQQNCFSSAFATAHFHATMPLRIYHTRSCIYFSSPCYTLSTLCHMLLLTQLLLLLLWKVFKMWVKMLAGVSVLPKRRRKWLQVQQSAHHIEWQLECCSINVFTVGSYLTKVKYKKLNNNKMI